MAKDLAGKEPITKEKIDNLIHELPTDQDQPFCMHHINFNQVLHEIESIQNDCSAGGDNIPTNLIKLVANVIASPLTEIINNSIDISIFLEQ